MPLTSSKVELRLKCVRAPAGFTSSSIVSSRKLMFCPAHFMIFELFLSEIRTAFVPIEKF